MTTLPNEGNLVIRRSEGDVLWIGDAKVTIASISGDRVSLAINAPRTTKILRDELMPVDESEAVALLDAAKTATAWNGHVDRIVRGNHGIYPDYWKSAVIESGLMARKAVELKENHTKE